MLLKATMVTAISRRLRPRFKSIAVAGAGVVVGMSIAPATVNAAVNYFDATKTVSGTGSVSCPYGWKVTGGGSYPLPSNYFSSSTSREYQLTGSYPSYSGWRATATVVTGSYSSYSGWKFYTSSYSPTVYAVCTS